MRDLLYMSPAAEQRRHEVTLLLSGTASSVIDRLARVLAEQVLAEGWRPVMCPRARPSSGTGFLVGATGAKALFILADDEDVWNVGAAYCDRGWPCVAVGVDAGDARASAVLLDQQRTARMAVAALRRKVDAIAIEWTPALGVADGWNAAASDANLPVVASFQPGELRQTAETFLAADVERLGLVCWSPEAALAASIAAQRVRVNPEESLHIVVVGAELQNPPAAWFSSLFVSERTLAVIATRLMRELMVDPTLPAHRRLLLPDPQLFITL